MRFLRRIPMRVRGAILSLLLPGLGQAYLDRLWRGAIWFAGLVVLSIMVRSADTGWNTVALAATLNVLAAADAAIVGPAETRRDSP